MKKTYKLQNLDCAHCAAKMERGIQKINGVSDAKVNFMASRLTIEAEDSGFDNVMKDVISVCRKIEPDCKILV